jgi:amidohydrolase
VGQIALKVGPITSAVDQVNIVLKGTGGHTSRPQLTQDVIGALGALATLTQLLLSRRIDPRSGVSLMWGSMHSGSVANAIPQPAKSWERYARSTPTAGTRPSNSSRTGRRDRPTVRVEVDVVVTDGVPPAVNHARGVRRLTRAAEQILGPDAVTITEQSLGGEDFSWMLQEFRVPWRGSGSELPVRCAQTFTSRPSWWMRPAYRPASGAC